MATKPSTPGVIPWQHWTLILGTALVVLVVLAFWVVPPLTVPDEGFKSRAELVKARNDVRTAALQVIAGLVVATGLVLTARSVGLTAQSIQISREGQVTERFSRSVEQLGHESQEVRIGGIYALERIAKDSIPDRQTVLEVVTAYIREHAKEPSEYDDEQLRVAKENYPWQIGDIAAAINVIRRWQWSHAERLDLETTRLHGANLAGANLARARLAKADLTEADLTEADLTEAALNRITLEGARLTGAHVREAILLRADLYMADFTLADLTGADLTGADLRYADFSRANLSETTLSEATYNAETQWPEDFDPVGAGAVLVTDGDAPNAE